MCHLKSLQTTSMRTEKLLEEQIETEIFLKVRSDFYLLQGATYAIFIIAEFQFLFHFQFYFIRF